MRRTFSALALSVVFFFPADPVRVRTASCVAIGPPRHIQQRHAEPHHQLPGNVPRPGQTDSSNRHAGPPSPQRTGLSACQDLYEDHPHITQMSASAERVCSGVKVRP
jgi:hypothetical protein